MAKKVQTILVSDISGDDASEGDSVEFSYRGVSYSIDLTKREADKSDKTMEFYTAHAQRKGGRRSARAGKGRADRSQLLAIREWARSAGLKVSDRGRVSQEVQDAYNAAH